MKRIDEPQVFGTPKKFCRLDVVADGSLDWAASVQCLDLLVPSFERETLEANEVCQ